MLVRSPTVIELTSPRRTVLNQIELSRPTVTSPISTAVSATNVPSPTPPYLFYICHIDSSFSYCGCGNTPHPLSCKNRNSAREFQLFGRRSGEKSFGLNPSRTSARFAAAGRHSTSRSGSQSAAWEGGGYTKQGHLPANPRFFPFPPPIVLHIFNSALRKMRINLLLRPTFPIFARRNSARERGDGMWKDLTDCKPQ